MPSAFIALALRVGQLRQRSLALRQERLIQLQRQQVRVREIAVIVRVFLRPERAGDALVRIEQPGLLRHRAAALDQLDLPLRLMLDHRHDEAHRIDILGLGPSPELAAGLAHADVDVGAHRALFHISVARADVAEDRSQLPEVSSCFGGRTHVGPRHDFHQRDAAAVQIDVAHRRVLVVHQLARVLLDVDALDADALGRRLVLLVDENLDLALADQRMIELADLIALREVGVEIILPVEPAPAVDPGVERHARPHGLPDALAVRHRKHSRHRRVDQAHLRVRLGPEGGRSAGEELGLARGDLRVDFETDHDLPLAGFALDAEGCSCVSHDFSSSSPRFRGEVAVRSADGGVLPLYQEPLHRLRRSPSRPNAGEDE